MGNLNIKLKKSHGALLRTLGLIERKGHRYSGFRSTEQKDGWEIEVTMQDNTTRLETLVKQINNLTDVVSVNVKQVVTQPFAVSEG